MRAAQKKIQELLALADITVGGDRPWDLTVCPAATGVLSEHSEPETG